jgi:hypothetical protein
MDTCVCSTPEQLKRLVNEQLDGPERERVAAHVQDCSLCQQVLERLTQGPFPERPHGPDPDEPSRDTTFLEGIKALMPVPPDEEPTECNVPIVPTGTEATNLSRNASVTVGIYTE